jgi:hypothetical protein
VTPDNISPIQRNSDQGMREKLKKKAGLVARAGGS